ncbi:Aste57867_16019 [Aphanomyces stellatus]|uniref:Aste57867_16019 protein n=1 Tax=Aphanomyces stellatus TaxID=120398 RepID=A0A485L4T2_9STRA|nr:hypothetical protein As57867_015963 [Aphanomyces stellatus]VFT92804.1 Aste57867_16019 [Aphanomyces stellatus]
MLPLENVFGLVVRTLTKPIVGEMKQRSKTQAWMKNGCEEVGRRVHRWNIAAHVSVQGGGRVQVKIKELSSEDAFKKGSEFLGESLIFLVAAAVMVADYTRSTNKAVAKEKAEVEHNFEEFLTMEGRFRALESSMRQLQNTRQNLQDTLSIQLPHSSKPVDS